jgi:hypothetical protein
MRHEMGSTFLWSGLVVVAAALGFYEPDDRPTSPAAAIRARPEIPPAGAPIRFEPRSSGARCCDAEPVTVS